MDIHGVRFVPEPASRPPDGSTTGRLAVSLGERGANFLRAFLPLAPSLRGHVVAAEFEPARAGDSATGDPMPPVRKRFGADLVAADAECGLVLLRGEGFERWGRRLAPGERAVVAAFREPPTYHFLLHLYSPEFRLNSKSWPRGLRAVFHNWGDVYWEVFTAERADADAVIGAHAADATLTMFAVDVDLDFPYPSSRPLPRAAVAQADGE